MGVNVTNLREALREAAGLAANAGEALKRAAAAADAATLVEAAEAVESGLNALASAREAARAALRAALSEARADELLAGLGFSERAVILLSDQERDRLVDKAKEIVLGGAEAAS